MCLRRAPTITRAQVRRKREPDECDFRISETEILGLARLADALPRTTLFEAQHAIAVLVLGDDDVVVPRTSFRREAFRAPAQVRSTSSASTTRRRDCAMGFIFMGRRFYAMATRGHRAPAGGRGAAQRASTASGEPCVHRQRFRQRSAIIFMSARISLRSSMPARRTARRVRDSYLLGAATCLLPN